jgi:signal transduction histidine kinase/HPt (histidine-containing phosphotransfer) domain-containing protein/ActR/RegA family two-component response regulator
MTFREKILTRIISNINNVRLLFIVTSLTVFFLSMYTSVILWRYMESEEYNITERLKALAIAASSLVSGEELDSYSDAADMELPQYTQLKEKLMDFSEKVDVLYVYYMRMAGDKIQYIVENDSNEETGPVVGLDTPPVDPEVERGVEHAFEGEVSCGGIGMYTEGWEGLMSAYAPVYGSDGKILAAVGVDIEDVQIMSTRRNMKKITVLQIFAFAFVIASGLASLWGYRLSALRADEANRSKSIFLAKMSHEIRTPMNAVIGMSELILREDVPPSVRENAEHVRHAGNNLLSIINDILDFSKIESGKMEITPREYLLHSLLNDVINIIRMRLSEKNIRLITEIDGSLPCGLEGDEVRVRQVLLNILSNAVKYTFEGCVSFSARGKKCGDGEILMTFEVSDTGIGIKEENLVRLFGDFIRFDNDTDKNIEGTGLGLAITKRLCLAMGGDVFVSSVFGEGSVFTVTFPQKITDDKPLGEMDTLIHDSNETPDARIDFTAPEARILIVDDIETNLKVAEGLLAPYKMKIRTCGSGSEAVRMAQEGIYDVILMDHMMPEMNGIEATAAIRAMEGEYFRTVPIIALTANAISGMRETFLRNGFNDFLSKPIEISKLNEIIERWVPAEKRIAGGRQERGSGSQTEIGFEIEGVDAVRGLAMTGGTAERYIGVLELYCRDADKRIEILSIVPDEPGLAAFITQVHALKSASASIGAASLSEKAAMLEDAGHRGDIAAIAEGLDGFREEISRVVESIRQALPPKEEGPEDGEAVLDKTALLRLKEALEAEDIGNVDRLIAELSGKPIGGIDRDSLSKISDLALVGEFKEALTIAEKLAE